MPEHRKEYGVYHWDTFDDETTLVYECRTLAEAQRYVQQKYGSRIGIDGADQVHIVDRHGDVQERFDVR
jgi:hypothetical protein